jgi:hypothetical protein
MYYKPLFYKQVYIIYNGLSRPLRDILVKKWRNNEEVELGFTKNSLLALNEWG